MDLQNYEMNFILLMVFMNLHYVFVSIFKNYVNLLFILFVMVIRMME